MNTRHRIIADLIIVVCTTTLVFLIAEKFYSRWSGSYRYKYAFHDEFPCFSFNSLLGSGLKPNCQSIWRRQQGNTEIFNVHFTTDKDGRRLVPRNGTKDEGAIFFAGGSDILGLGVNDDETLPYFFHEKSRKQKAINLGGNGYGPQQLLAVLERGALVEKSPVVRNAKMIYFFSNAQVRRAVGAWQVSGIFGAHFPYYKSDGNGGVVWAGDFESGRPIVGFIYKVIKKSNILVDLYQRISKLQKLTNEDVKLTAKIIIAAKRKFQQICANSRFFVVVMPGTSTRLTTILKSQLDSENIPYFDYSDLLDFSQPKFITKDSHPTALTNRIIAERLVEDLRVRGEAF